MLRSLIAFCLSRRLLVLVAFAAFLGLGFAAFAALNIEGRLIQKPGGNISGLLRGQVCDRHAAARTMDLWLHDPLNEPFACLG